LQRWVPAKAWQANERSFELGLEWRPEEVAPSATDKVRPAELVTTSTVEVNAGWCKGAACSICIDVCPERIFVMGPESFAVPAGAERCTGCNLCMKLCPDFAIEVTTTTTGRPEAGAPGTHEEIRHG
jgi:2-oxoglutarate ferredoxin oxidoreductase subunit delta